MKNLSVEAMSNRATPVWKIAGLCILLASLVWLVFGQTLGHQFVNLDDESYVYANPVVSQGLTAQAIGWASTHIVSHNWHPLTTISHMVDCQLFDLKPAGHHFTNVMLHTIAAILLLIVLDQMTGALWRSAFVAAIFAIHPLRVESVAWIAERKDVLSAVFFMLTIGAYVQFVRRPTFLRYLILSIFFALGLMSKPMLVTVPFVLLLLVYWPLHRFQTAGSTISNLLLEKIPLLILAAPVAAVTVVIQRHGINSVENLSPPWRIGNAFVSLLIYIRQMLWPFDLAVFYPHSGDQLPLWQIAISSALFIAITAAVFVVRKQRPYFLSGWLWYVSMLAPVIGIIQVGAQAHADRYTDLPQIGCYLIVAWTAADVAAPWRRSALVSGVLAIGVIAILIAGARVQTSYWRDRDTLWTHTLARTSPNAVAHNNSGAPLVKDDRLTEAVAHFRGALDINPNDTVAYQNLGAALMQTGHVSQAIVAFEKALEIDPNYAEAHDGLGDALLETGRVDEAIAHYTRALAIDPDQAEFHNGLGNALLRTGRVDEAI